MNRPIVLALLCQTRVHNALVILISRETLSAMFGPCNPGNNRSGRRRLDATPRHLGALKEQKPCSGELW
jgi:hypothetical protein